MNEAADYEAILAEYTRAKKELVEVLKDSVVATDVFASVFTGLRVHPDIRGFVWTQYTPYFNDGEPCVFGVHGLGLWLHSDELDEDEWPDPYTHEVYQMDYGPRAGELVVSNAIENHPDSQALKECAAEIVGRFNAIDTLVFESAFGDGYQVLAEFVSDDGTLKTRAREYGHY